jgi:serine/threonine protein kinase
VVSRHANWSKLTSQCNNCVMNMLTKDEEQRPSAEDLLKHPWFSMINSESLAHNKLKKVTKNLEYWSSDATIFQKGMSIYMSNL